MRQSSWWPSFALLAGLSVACQDQPEQSRSEFLIPEASPQRIPGSYALVDIGPLPGDDYSYPMALNNRSEVTGLSGMVYDYSFVNSFYWNPVDGVTNLGSPSNHSYVVANDINDSGRIVGSLLSYAETARGFVWHQGNFTLIEPPPGASYIETWGINRAGHLVGSTDFTPGVSEAFLLREGPPVPLGLVEGGSTSVATAINDGGDVIGYGDNAAGDYVGLLWLDGAQMIDLSTVLSVPDFFPYAISETRQLVGYAPSLGHALLVEAGQVTDLGSLEGTGGSSYALSLNASTQVVGASLTSGGLYHAFVWEDGVMADLNELVDPAEQVELIEATDINDNGEIVVLGFRGGAFRGFLLRPE